MEHCIFENMSKIEICRKMSVICQQSADENFPGVDKARYQIVSDYFKGEADALTIAEKIAYLLALQDPNIVVLDA